MSQAYFLFPGLLLPEEARPHLSTETLAVADRLSSAVKGNVVRQTLVAGPLTGSVHLAWVWQVVTRRPLPFSSAPFAWLIDDGPDLTSEIWSLTCFTTENGRPADIALTDDTVENLAVLLRRPLEERGFTLQRWDKTFYLTRQTGWGVVAPEWPVIRAGLVSYDSLAPLPEADASVLTGALDDLHELNRLLADARLTDAEGRPITGLAVTGGGCQQRFNPPTKIRSVLADTPFILGPGIRHSQPPHGTRDGHDRLAGRRAGRGRSRRYRRALRTLVKPQLDALVTTPSGRGERV